MLCHWCCVGFGSDLNQSLTRKGAPEVLARKVLYGNSLPLRAGEAPFYVACPTML
jgi:hypothetical protein